MENRADIVCELIQLNQGIYTRLERLNLINPNLIFIDAQLALFNQYYNQLKTSPAPLVKIEVTLDHVFKFAGRVATQLVGKIKESDYTKILTQYNLKNYLHRLKLFLSSQPGFEFKPELDHCSKLNFIENICSLFGLDLTYFYNALVLPEDKYKQFISFTVNWILNTLEDAELSNDLDTEDGTDSDDTPTPVEEHPMAKLFSSMFNSQLIGSDNIIKDIFTEIIDKTKTKSGSNIFDLLQENVSAIQENISTLQENMVKEPDQTEQA